MSALIDNVACFCLGVMLSGAIDAIWKAAKAVTLNAWKAHKEYRLP